MKRYTILLIIFLNLSPNKFFTNIKNKNEFGLHLGDAIAIKIPVRKNTSFNVHTGIWTWRFWHGIHYGTPYLSIDYSYYFPFRQSSNSYYIGIGMAFSLLIIQKIPGIMIEL